MTRNRLPPPNTIRPTPLFNTKVNTKHTINTTLSKPISNHLNGLHSAELTEPPPTAPPPSKVAILP